MTDTTTVAPILGETGRSAETTHSVYLAVDGAPPMPAAGEFQRHHLTPTRLTTLTWSTWDDDAVVIASVQGKIRARSGRTHGGHAQLSHSGGGDLPESCDRPGSDSVNRGDGYDHTLDTGQPDDGLEPCSACGSAEDPCDCGSATPPAGCTAARWESITPTDDGHLIIDCPVHGEIGTVPTPGDLDTVVVGDDESGRIALLWADHTQRAQR